MRLEVSVVSHVGNVRQNNEDNFYLQGTLRQVLEETITRAYWQGKPQAALFAVADGMGGEANGEIASLVTVQSLCPCGIDRVHAVAQDSIWQANEMLCDEMRQNGGRRMGSTLAALYVDKGKFIVCNVGDSRVYLLRDGELQQVSIDHTRVQQMVNMGVITPEQARTHKHRHILTQNIGIFPEEMIIQPAFSQANTLKAGDVFLLCSDGLTDMVSDEEICHILMAGKPEEQVQKLVERALKNGGRDNVTAMVAQVKEQWSALPHFITESRAK